MQSKDSPEPATIDGCTELMKNHKAAKLLTASSSFKAMQTQSNNAMLFHISEEKSLDLAVETPGSRTGWTLSNLTAELSSRHAGKRVFVKKFAANQTRVARILKIVVAVQVEGEPLDFIYMRLSSKDGAEWVNSADHRTWTAVSIKGLPLCNGSLAIQSLLLGVDNVMGIQVLTHSGLKNFFQNPMDKSWIKVLAEDSSKKVLSQPGSLLSAGNNDLLFYQLTDENGSLKLVYRNIWPYDGDEISLSCPEGTSTMTALPTNHGNLLFVAAKEEVVMFDEDNLPSQIISNPIISGVQQLYSLDFGGQIYLWGLNQKGEVFYSKCNKDISKFESSWSYPLPLLSGVTQISTFVNDRTGASTVFARTEHGQFIKLTQDTITTHWHSQSVILPSADTSKVTEYNSYTSHVQLTATSGLPLVDEPVSITATSPCSLYVNDVYHALSPGKPMPVQTDALGSVTLVHETRALGSVCYQLEMKNGQKATINPMSKILDTISSVKSGSDLDKIHVPDGNGGTALLLPASVQPQHKKDTTRSLQQFVQMAKKMPQDGTMSQNYSLVGESAQLQAVLQTNLELHGACLLKIVPAATTKERMP